MTTPVSKNVRVGLLVTIALALLMSGTFLIGQERGLWERRVEYEIRFQRANGLRKGSAVSLSGVDVGSVQDVSFPPDPGADYISVRILVSPGAAGRIRASTIARILTLGVLGDKYVELSPGSALAPELQAGAIIPSEDPIDYEKLLGRGGDIISNIVEASNSLKNVFGAIDRGEGLLGQMLRDRERGTAIAGDLEKTVAHLEATTAEIEQIAKDLRAGKGAFGILLRRGNEVEGALASLSRASGALERLALRLEQAQGALPRLIEDRAYAEGLLTDLRTSADDLAELARKANRGEGTVGRLVNDPALYQNADQLIRDARSSWVFSLYRGVRGIFPPYTSGEPRTEPIAATTPSRPGSHWWADD